MVSALCGLPVYGTCSIKVFQFIFYFFTIGNWDFFWGYRKSTDHVGKRIAYYKYLAIFNKCHMNCYLPITLPSRLTLFGLLVVISAHLLLRYGHRLILFERFLVFQLLLWSIVTAFLCILVSGKIYKSSSRALVRFRSYDKHTKYTRKSLRALRPFGVKAGPSKTLTYGTLNAYSVVVLKALTTILVRFPPRWQIYANITCHEIIFINKTIVHVGLKWVSNISYTLKTKYSI